MNERYESDDNLRRRFSTTPADSAPIPAGDVVHDRLIGLLVTGDLDEARRRMLVAWLEERPERWRQCGLAFLEAQAWHEGMLEMIGKAECGADRFAGAELLNSDRPGASGEFRPAEPPRAAYSGRLTRASFMLRTVGAMAASALLAYPLGVVTGPRWHNEVSTVSATDAARPAPGGVTHGANDASQDKAEHPEAPRVDSRGSRVAEHHATPPAQTFAVMKYHSERNGTREIHVPVVAGSDVDEQLLSAEPISLPEDVQDELEKRGFQLQQRRQFLNVRLEDGRQAIIPVDQYQVSFVKHLSL